MTEEAPPESVQSTEPVQPESTPLIDKANEAAERLEKASAAMDKSNHMRQQLEVEKTLGGQAAVTGEQQEESPGDYAKRVMAGDVDGKD